MLNLSAVKVTMIDVLTSVYIVSLISMCIVTNIRPIFVNYWDAEADLQKYSLQPMDLGQGLHHTLMVANQIVIMVLGS